MIKELKCFESKLQSNEEERLQPSSRRTIQRNAKEKKKKLETYKRWGAASCSFNTH
jgi:hypothetical protein